MIHVLIPVADGAEEMEIVIIVDVLRRAGWDVVTTSIDGLTITASRNVRIVADTAWEDVSLDDFDALILPGGIGGTDRLLTHSGVLSAIRSFEDAGKIVGAICAGPLVLQKAGILEMRKATCHPGVRDAFRPGTISNDRVVWDGHVVTSQAPGTATEFALEIISKIDGADAAQTVASGLVLP